MATITLLRPVPAEEPESVARPRVVLGLDAFGQEALSALPVTGGAIVDAQASGWDGVEARLDEALANPAWHDAQAIEPIIIALADLGGDAADELTQGLGGVIERTLHTQIALSAIVILRFLERGPERVDVARAKRQIRGFIDAVLAPGQPGHGRVTVVVIANRDGAGHVYQPDECALKARHLLSLLLDPRTGDDTRLRRSLAPLATGFGETGDPWGWTAAFAAIDFRIFVYPAADVAAARTRSLVSWLEPALTASPPTSWEPRVPRLGSVGTEMETRLAHPGLPRWNPDLWRPVAEDIARARRAVAGWIERAREWSEEQRIRVASRRLALTGEGATALSDFRQQAAADLSALLTDESLPGLWLSLEQWLAAALSGIGEPTQPPAAKPAALAPATSLTATEKRVREAIARRTNARLVVCAAITSLLLGTGLILAAAETGSITPELTAAWKIASAILSLPVSGTVSAIAAVALMVSLSCWLTLLLARIALERAWDREVHTPIVRWATAAVAHHRSTVAAHAAQVRRDIACQARDELLAIERRVLALRDAFSPSAALTDPAVHGEEWVDRFTWRIEPSPAAVTGEPNTAARTMRADPELTRWLVSGSVADAAILRDRLLVAVDNSAGTGLAGDLQCLQRVMDHVTDGRTDARRAVSLKPHYLAAPRWTTDTFLVVPEALETALPVLAHGATVLAGAEDQIAALSVVSGLTAADLFGPIADQTDLSESEETA